MKILLLTGGKLHDFNSISDTLENLLGKAGHQVERSSEIAALETELDSIDALVLHLRQDHLTPGQAERLLGFVENGGRIVALHGAGSSFSRNETYRNLIGCEFTGHPPAFKLTIDFTKTDHPMTENMHSFSLVDELYGIKLRGSGHEIVAESTWRSKKMPVAYTKKVGSGRLFYLSLGHDARALKHPMVERLILRGLNWTSGQFDPSPVETRWGVIGYGGAFNMGKQHFEAINERAGMRATAVCDIDESRLVQARQELGENIQTYTDADELLANPEIDAVVIILPHNLHYPYARKSLEAGKHVVTEKPFVITTEEADDLIALSRTHNRMLSIFHNRVWDYDYRQMKALIDTGVIGEVFQVNACFGSANRPHGNWWRDDKDVSGGIMHDWGAHFWCWINRLMPHKIKDVTGFFHHLRWKHVSNHDHGLAVVRFENNYSASFEISHLAHNGDIPKWRVLGTRGTILMMKNEIVLMSQNDNNEEVRTTIAMNKKQPLAGQDYYDTIANHLRFGEALEITAMEARNVIAVIDTALKSSETGRSLPFPEATAKTNR